MKKILKISKFVLLFNISLFVCFGCTIQTTIVYKRTPAKIGSKNLISKEEKVIWFWDKYK